MITVDREKFIEMKKLLGDYIKMSFELVSLAADLLPVKKSEKFIEIFEKHHSANCGNIRRWAKEKIEPEKEEKPVENDNSLPIIDWDEFDKFYNEKYMEKTQQ